jgi:hypothetical protein
VTREDLQNAIAEMALVGFGGRTSSNSPIPRARLLLRGGGTALTESGGEGAVVKSFVATARRSVLELHDLDARRLRDADPAPIANKISDFDCSARCYWCVFGGESLNGNCAESCRGYQQFQRDASGPRIVVRVAFARCSHFIDAHGVWRALGTHTLACRAGSCREAAELVKVAQAPAVM